MSVYAEVHYADPEADITAVHVEFSDGSTLVVPVAGPLPGPVGMLFGSIEFSTETSGVFTVRIWAVDAGGNESNRVTTTLTVIREHAAHGSHRFRGSVRETVLQARRRRPPRRHGQRHDDLDDRHRPARGSELDGRDQRHADPGRCSK